MLGEAMAAGLPIITTRVGAHAEAVRDGKTGFLIEPDDTGALLGRIERFLQAPELAPQMGAAARAFGEERFDARANTQAIGDMLVDVAARPPLRSTRERERHEVPA